MLVALFAGILAALVAVVPYQLHARAPFVSSPVFLLAIVGFAIVFQRFVLDRRSASRTYDGLADLFIHVHSPSNPDSPLRWAARGLISALLAACCGIAGAEGASIELTHAAVIRFRSRASRWFEQRRRTDASTALAAGVAAAFGSPFGAILLPLELGLGGRQLSAVTAALAAFFGVRVLSRAFPQITGGFPDLSIASVGISVFDYRVWCVALAVGVTAGALSAGVIYFFRYTQESLVDLFRTQSWMRMLTTGVLLFLIVIIFPPSQEMPARLIEQAFQGTESASATGLMFCTRLVLLALVLAGFGTMGLFWPLFALGGIFGSLLGQAASMPAFAGLCGAVAFWSAFLGTPLSGAVVALELSHSFDLLMPCLLAGVVAKEVRQRLQVKTLFADDLEVRGVRLLDGRAATVLDSIAVRDAMVTDHDSVHEHEPVSGIHARLARARYPFLPVVNAQGAFVGMLTVDMVQEAWRRQSAASNSPLSNLLEAKDLLYRYGGVAPSFKISDKLSASHGVFDRLPCVPVLSDDNKVVGLLFVYNVRLAYDREVARRSMLFEEQREK